MVLTKEELYDRIKAKYGDSDEDLKDIEDLTDTIEEMSKKEIDQDAINAAVEAKDKEWRQKYRDRFFGGKSDEDAKIETQDTNSYKPEEITYQNIFDGVYDD